ncbi:hypothetical protein D9619_002654 [Psilocybe cf. subviscida]|uniref:Uncharacterized protein n=1 Tax=Psilocybe cf. subviscida TaxID=2480587 RepID=A0A8H5AWW0_9AGAR|nr:hypothetical protein D9619_002654 [Psilocybe cf. subviscida]
MHPSALFACTHISPASFFPSRTPPVLPPLPPSGARSCTRKFRRVPPCPISSPRLHLRPTFAMPPKSVPKAAAAEKPVRKTKSSGAAGGKKKLTAFNKFMVRFYIFGGGHELTAGFYHGQQTEMARLKEDEPDMTHKDRFKLATGNWKTAKENPKAA